MVLVDSRYFAASSAISSSLLPPAINPSSSSLTTSALRIAIVGREVYEGNATRGARWRYSWADW